MRASAFDSYENCNEKLHDYLPIKDVRNYRFLLCLVAYLPTKALTSALTDCLWEHFQHLTLFSETYRKSTFQMRKKISKEIRTVNNFVDSILRH